RSGTTVPRPRGSASHRPDGARAAAIPTRALCCLSVRRLRLAASPRRRGVPLACCRNECADGQAVPAFLFFQVATRGTAAAVECGESPRGSSWLGVRRPESAMTQLLVREREFRGFSVALEQAQAQHLLTLGSRTEAVHPILVVESLASAPKPATPAP